MVKDAEERPARVPEYAGAPEKRGALLVNDSNKPEMSAGLEKDSLENTLAPCLIAVVLPTDRRL